MRDMNRAIRTAHSHRNERIDLLEAIDRMGSISGAAKQLDLSYRFAWDAVDAINNLAEEPVLICASGGHPGGGSYLTERGREMVRMHRLLESGYQRLWAQIQAQVGDFDQLNALLKAITMKTSARNQFRGTVKTIRPASVSADVVLDIGDGLEIVASITNEAVEDLRLAPGRAAIALIKASFIMLSPDEPIRTSAHNRLAGVVSAVIAGGVNSEVNIQLAGERVLTAIVTGEALRELDLADGSCCCALVNASHVLIAVNG
jgi:molybdate transport system regulatory protein